MWKLFRSKCISNLYTIDETWGEWEMLKIIDFTYYGDIYAETDVKLLYLTIEDFRQLYFTVL